MEERFSVKVYPFPGDNLSELPENVLQYLENEYGLIRNDPDEVPNFLRENSILVMTYNDKIVLFKSDGGEPEDQTLFRNWDWVSGAIQKAYELGRLSVKENFEEMLK